MDLLFVIRSDYPPVVSGNIISVMNIKDIYCLKVNLNSHINSTDKWEQNSKWFKSCTTKPTLSSNLYHKSLAQDKIKILTVSKIPSNIWPSKIITPLLECSVSYQILAGKFLHIKFEDK